MPTQISYLGELIRAIAQANFGGYCVDYEISQEHSNGGFLIVHVRVSNPRDYDTVIDYVGVNFLGQFWFDADDELAMVK